MLCAAGTASKFTTMEGLSIKKVWLVKIYCLKIHTPAGMPNREDCILKGLSRYLGEGS